ncbi:GDP-mannose 4,6-dehydratase [Marinobacterium sp. AK62]|uniref:GDP-mannose 4,6-dehydratase n=1 Tax=Marinobacterium alkalitolerans TaxID=1542925 RepID=A0ABS3ZDD5_9GAMM|nr:GDP-mannose 4,6-dehydratase [Marinobacterium alkalitolerans]MBP0049714.1 GDP-mannose 4,6-dehydratase [Marinobacterium alkalitolerans]
MGKRAEHILVTGGTGFVGRYLIAELQRTLPAAKLFVTGRSVISASADVQVLPLDITDAAAVQQVVAQVQPDKVFHLAAQANVADSFKAPALTWQVNLQGSLNLFAALEALTHPVVLLNVGSADMYGRTFLQGRVEETAPLAPLNPYAASKAAADLAACALASSSSVQVVRLRPFNHAGPGQGEGFVIPAFAAQIARIEAGLQSPRLQVGDLSARRDFLHVQDVVAAYSAVAQAAEAVQSGTILNVCSGVSHSVQSVLEALLAAARVDIEVVQDPARMRKSDIPVAEGSHAALQKLTGWAPTVSVEALAVSVLDSWRQYVSGRHE